MHLSHLQEEIVEELSTGHKDASNFYVWEAGGRSNGGQRESKGVPVVIARMMRSCSREHNRLEIGGGSMLHKPEAQVQVGDHVLCVGGVWRSTHICTAKGQCKFGIRGIVEGVNKQVKDSSCKTKKRNMKEQILERVDVSQGIPG